MVRSFFYRRYFSIDFFQIVVPPLPGKAWKRQMPFRNDDGIFEEEFIEERRKGLEVFINKYVVIKKKFELTFEYFSINSGLR